MLAGSSLPAKTVRFHIKKKDEGGRTLDALDIIEDQMGALFARRGRVEAVYALIRKAAIATGTLCSK